MKKIIKKTVGFISILQLFPVYFGLCELGSNKRFLDGYITIMSVQLFVVILFGSMAALIMLAKWGFKEEKK